MSYGELSPPPEFRHLESDTMRARLVALRADVAPILANNVLNHFTDHSVSHSDSLVGLVDDLLAPLQSQRAGVRLGAEELVVLYGACYLHDVGMQLEAAGHTKVVQSLELSTPWESLSEEARREILRRHHPSISAEMIRSSVSVASPWINHHLTPEYQPDCIARVCEAHTLDVGSPLYTKLMRREPRVRMAVVSGLLRIADILDESRRRALAAKGRTLLLDLVSQAHWWRHYYTKDITFTEDERCIVLWFYYPCELFDSYQQVVPRLQLPLIEAELQRHNRYFLPLNFGWWVKAEERGDDAGLTEAMPEAVVGAMRRILREHDKPANLETAIGSPALREGKGSRDAAEHLLEARPYIDRRVAELAGLKEQLPCTDYLLELNKLATEVWELGAKRTAWTLISGDFDRDGKNLPTVTRLAIGINLIRMMLLDDASWHACLVTESLRETAESLADDDPRKAEFWALRARSMNSQCAYDQATQSYERAIELCRDNELKGALLAQFSEMHMLQGEFERAQRLAE